MSRTLYLIRHTTPDIALGTCYGQLDVGVAPGFAEEASRTLGWLPPQQLVLTSPLIRASTLAAYLADAWRSELRSDARLMEKHFGAWEGRAWGSIAREELDAWAADFMEYAPPGGESAQQVMSRAHALLQDVSALPHASVALVAHAGSIRALLAQLAGLPLAATLAWDMPFGAVIGAKL